MSIAVTVEHEELATSVRRWVARHSPPEHVRAAFDDDDATTPSELWPSLAAQGLLGLHLSEEFGGAGGGPVELAVLCEELGRGLVPGPVLPTLLGSLLLQRTAPRALAKEILPGVAEGTTVAGRGARRGTSLAATRADGGWHLTGTAALVLEAARADVLVLGAVDATGPRSGRRSRRDRVHMEPRDALDRTRRPARVDVDGDVPADVCLEGLDRGPGASRRRVAARRRGGRGAGRCLDTSAAYARTREQFGVPIGEFQAIKHRCADMLVDVEEAAACAWDAAVAARRTSRTRSGSRGRRGRSGAHGGGRVRQGHDPGPRWHGLHVGARQPPVPAAGGHGAPAGRPPGRLAERVARCALDGARRVVSLDAGDDGRRERDPRAGRRRRRAWRGTSSAGVLADNGFLAPHWPRPWGRGADAREQLVIGRGTLPPGVRMPPLVMADWVLPTLIAHGSDAQRERFIRSTLYGEITWCQMFSEPGAGPTSRACRHAPSGSRAGGGSTGRRCGPPSRSTPTGRSASPGPTQRPEARGHHLLPRRHASPRASTCDRCGRSPATRCSTRSSSTTCSCRTTASSGRSTTGGTTRATTLDNERVAIAEGPVHGHRPRGCWRGRAARADRGSVGPRTAGALVARAARWRSWACERPLARSPGCRPRRARASASWWRAPPART